jgi:hypothetical protein
MVVNNFAIASSYSRLRDDVNTLDLAQQREFGLQELRDDGVLQ